VFVSIAVRQLEAGLDLEHYLRRLGDDAPSGENLEYDPEFTELELAATPGEERQVGDSILPAEEPDYREVAEKALAVMERSHDLRAGALLALARLRLDGIVGLAEGTGYIRGCLEQYWDTCHPQLDADDDNDPTMRINAIQQLADGDTMLRGMRLAPLTDSRSFGRFSLRDIAVAEGEMAPPPGMDSVPDRSAVNAAFRDSDGEWIARTLEAARSVQADLKAIDACFVENTPGQGPDLDAAHRLMRQIVGKLTEAAGGDPEPEADDDVPGDGAAPSGGPVRGTPGVIAGTGDVIAALDQIVAYYRRNEPSSPVPLLLQRAKRLVGADFLVIMRDMAPQGLENVHQIGGIDDDD
jgi:type VI secretion system protein ImpA